MDFRIDQAGARTNVGQPAPGFTVCVAGLKTAAVVFKFDQ